MAKISSLYFQSREESVESDRPQKAPVLESRETVAAKSRAHGIYKDFKQLKISIKKKCFLMKILFYVAGTSNGGSTQQQNLLSVNYMLTLLCCLYLSTLAASTLATTTSTNTTNLMKLTGVRTTTNTGNQLNPHFNSTFLATSAAVRDNSSSHQSSTSLSMLQLKHHLVFR